MAKRNRAKSIRRITKRAGERWMKQTRKFVEARHKEDSALTGAAARRRRQMMRGQLKADNGVVMEFDGQLDAAAVNRVLVGACDTMRDGIEHGED